MCFCSLFYACVIVVWSILCLCNHCFCIFLFSRFSWVYCYNYFIFIGDFPRPGVCLYPLISIYVPLLQFSPGQGTACVFFAYGPLYAYVILVLVLYWCSFFCVFFLSFFLHLTRGFYPLLLLFCGLGVIWFFFLPFSFASLGLVIGVLFFVFWFIASARPGVCLFGFWGCFICFGGCCSSVLNDGCFVVFLSSVSLILFRFLVFSG